MAAASGVRKIDNQWRKAAKNGINHRHAPALRARIALRAAHRGIAAALRCASSRCCAHAAARAHNAPFAKHLSFRAAAFRGCTAHICAPAPHNRSACRAWRDRATNAAYSGARSAAIARRCCGGGVNNIGAHWRGAMRHGGAAGANIIRRGSARTSHNGRAHRGKSIVSWHQRRTQQRRRQSAPISNARRRGVVA